MTWNEKTGPWRDVGGQITPRPCIWCGSNTEVTKEGLLKCQFCKKTFQTIGFNYSLKVQQ